ncbi:Fe-S cluster assembly protein HesB [Rufibacter radiotolerans]|uniref:Fe-S cluster assembly protein HesB n=1 Tax=Rufibacter radiotolerans TaxID=1379910 RepID=A0A0H4VMB7_9BACT|nr:DUF488 domain-containing protein [Rufibacter radiotolerans]AKQ46473.1 Fe-S cluster assembly protein HesB [Rufibacter radiotolerans]
MADTHPTIWTIGHSTRTTEEFLAALLHFEIKVLADVRRYPGSKKYPQFNVEALQAALAGVGIEYLPEIELGGRRKPHPNSKNTVWRSESFRGYADYTETEQFNTGLTTLMQVAAEKRTAYMCSEAVWWRCHRAIISDVLKEKGWRIEHIMKEGVTKEHPFTAAYLQKHPL